VTGQKKFALQPARDWTTMPPGHIVGRVCASCSNWYGCLLFSSGGKGKRI